MDISIPQKIAEWPRSAEILRPTVSLDALLPRVTSETLGPTLVSDALLPRVTSDPTCCPNQVVIQLTTALLIPDYRRFYDTPINDFQPSYFPLADGSLVTRPFIDDLVNSNITLLVTGILTMLFARNIFVSGDYLRRATIKKKSLFKVLFASQLLALVAFIPMIVSQFNQFPSCTVVTIVSRVATAISLVLLITWILGYKAYRCLNNSRFVLVSLVLFFCGSTVVFVLEMIGLRAERRLSGSCMHTTGLSFTRIYIILQLVQSFFICCCFFYAVYKSRGSPVARGRISIRLSMDDLADDRDANTSGRGWDYVPKKQAASPRRSFITSFLPIFCSQRDSQSRKLRKPSVTGQCPLSQPPRPSVVRISEAAHDRPSSPAPSSHSRLSRYVPRMELFREVMRDELCYTTFITASCVVVAVLALIGVNVRNGLTVSGWISLNWAIISLLAIHSFGRVIRRHERDAILQEPGSWQPTRVIESKATPPMSHRRPWRKTNDFDDKSDPFSETRGLTDSRGSWSSNSALSHHSNSSSPQEEKLPTMPPPSLRMEEFPSHARPAPLVIDENIDEQSFRKSWNLTSASGFSTLVDDKSYRDSVS